MILRTGLCHAEEPLDSLPSDSSLSKRVESPAFVLVIYCVSEKAHPSKHAAFFHLTAPQSGPAGLEQRCVINIIPPRVCHFCKELRTRKPFIFPFAVVQNGGETLRRF